MLPSDELLAAVTRDMMLEFDQSRFTCITTSTKKNDPFWTHFFEYVVNQESNLTTQTFPKCLILGGPDGIDDLHTTLSAVRASGVKIIIIHAEPPHINTILEISQKLSLQNIGEDVIWILTDLDITTRYDAKYVPDGTIGIAKAFNVSRNHTQDDGIDKILFYDALTVVHRALSRLVGNNAAVLHEINESLTARSREDFYRYFMGLCSSRRPHVRTARALTNNVGLNSKC